jgi:hypothetical protein
MSFLVRIADSGRTSDHVRKVPIGDNTMHARLDMKEGRLNAMIQSSFMRTSEQFSELLASRGVVLAEMGVRDIGLLRDDALLAVELLRKAEIPILGGDVWYRRNGRFELAFANWYTDPDTMEDQRAYSQRSCSATEQYIREFLKPAEAELLFVLVIGR